MTSNFFALLILLSGLAFLGIYLADSRSWHACLFCGTRTGEHSKDCQFKDKDV